mmetsp:Transcript_8439/g.23737  ORF Transcript_8439/g.23737 Transcript_8439/m.23737 type:complete len:266 (-) Transcript_8439:13-810(-)
MPGLGAQRVLLLALTWCLQVLSENDCPEFEVGEQVVLWDRSKLSKEEEEPPDNELLTIAACVMRGDSDFRATVLDLSGRDFELDTKALKVILTRTPPSGVLRAVAQIVFTALAVLAALTPKVLLPWYRQKKRREAQATQRGKAAPAPGQQGGQAAPASGQQGGPQEWKGWTSAAAGGDKPPVVITLNERGGIVVRGAIPECMNGTYNRHGEVNGKPQFFHSEEPRNSRGRTWYVPAQSRYFIGTDVEGGETAAMYTTVQEFPGVA